MLAYFWQELTKVGMVKFQQYSEPRTVIVHQDDIVSLVTLYQERHVIVPVTVLNVKTNKGLLMLVFQHTFTASSTTPVAG